MSDQLVWGWHSWSKVVRFDSHFEADQREVAQQKAAKHYRTKLYEQSKEYVLVPFDDPEYGLMSFTTFLANASFASTTMR